MAITFRQDKIPYDPYIGFSFNGVHSSTLNIKRVSSSDRYTKVLSPNQQITTNDLVGNGIEVSRVDLLGKTIDIPIAFDNVSQENLGKLKNLFITESLGDLILDEFPYKKYKVKSNGTHQLKFLCFLENGKRIYKGEGSLSFEMVSSFCEAVSPYFHYFFNYNTNLDNTITPEDHEILKNNFPVLFYRDNSQLKRLQNYNEAYTGSNFFFWTPMSPNIPIDPTIYLYINSKDINRIKSISIKFDYVEIQKDMEKGKLDSDYFYLKNLELTPDDQFLIINFKNFLVYGAKKGSTGKFISNGNDYSKNMSFTGGTLQQASKEWNQKWFHEVGSSLSNITTNYVRGQIIDLQVRPRIEIRFFLSDFPDAEQEMSLNPENPKKERPTCIYSILYTNKIY